MQSPKYVRQQIKNIDDALDNLRDFLVQGGSSLEIKVDGVHHHLNELAILIDDYYTNEE